MISMAGKYYKTFSKNPGDDEHHRISCPLCGTAQSRMLFDCGSYFFEKCRNCGLVFQNPRPSQECLIKRYDQDYFNYEIEGEKNFLDLMIKGLDDIGFFGRKPVRGDNTFLDIGCAAGILIEYLEKLGWETTGLDVCRASAEYGINKRKLNIKINTLEGEAFPDASFSFIHSSHVIEHIADPRSFVREIYRILKPSGTACIVTPNIDGLQARVYRKNWRLCIADHVILFSKRTLKRLLAEEGFRITGLKTWGGLTREAGRPVLKRILDPLAKKWGFGDVVMIAAEKIRV